MTVDRANFLLSAYVKCAGLPFAFNRGWGWRSETGITKAEDFYIWTVLQTLPMTDSYYDALVYISKGMKK